jgi:hypothetical protein
LTSPARPRTRTFPWRPDVFYPLTLLLLAIVVASFAAAGEDRPAPQDASFNEYDVKAVFLYHFTRYMQWPEEAEPEAFTIVVLGRSEILAPLQEIARKKTVGAKPLVVRQCLEIGQVGRPQILFIAKAAAPGLAQVLEKTRGTDILTVSEGEGLGGQGVAVNFVLREGNIKFEISEKALQEARIQTSSQLLKLAILIDEDKGRGER